MLNSPVEVLWFQTAPFSAFVALDPLHLVIAEILQFGRLHFHAKLDTRIMVGRNPEISNEERGVLPGMTKAASPFLLTQYLSKANLLPTCSLFQTDHP